MQGTAKTTTNRRNPTKNIKLHRYSRLLKFERLMHLNALIIKYPGLEWLQQILKTTFGCSGSVEVTHHRNRATIALIGEVI